MSSTSARNATSANNTPIRPNKSTNVNTVKSKPGAPNIATHKSYWRHNQIISPAKYLTSTDSTVKSAEQMDSLAQSPGPPTPLIYAQKPDPVVRIREGSAQLLRCATRDKLEINYWTKDEIMLFNVDMSKADRQLAARFSFIGDVQKFDYTIELREAQVEDSGIYRCHTYTPPLPEDRRRYDYIVTSNVTVEPIPVITQSPSALASEMNDHHVEASTQQQQQLLQHSQRSTILSHASMPQSELGLQTVNLIQPPANMTRLTPPTRLLSARNTSSNSLKMDARFTMPIFWPYLLLALAAILMLTNIYLIYSLVRRHTKRNRSDLESSPSSRERKLSSSSSSGVGSGHGSTSVRKLTTK